MTELVGYSTLQFHVGGLFDGEPIDDLAHLVRRERRGTPGPTLCGIDRFAPGAPGWSVAGGFHDQRRVCGGCDRARRRNLPVDGLNAHLFIIEAG